MPTPSEYKTVQARILAYAQESGWTYVPRAEAERRRGFDHSRATAAEQAAGASPYFDDLLDAQVRKLNPKYAEGPGALVGDLRRLHADIAGNRDFLAYLRNTRTFFDKGEGRERNLVLIDYEHPERNVFEVTEEFSCHNGRHGTREDVVFLINGIPILAIECKNATRDEAIALGVDQVRRYHAETPELFVPQMVFTATEAIGFAYGVTWNLLRRNIFNWKNEQKGNLEPKVNSFCYRGHVLALLRDYILFAEKDEELQKFILRQHQTAAVERVVERCLAAPPKTEARRGLVWHTQGSGKTFTMIKAAELLFKAAGADKPTVLPHLDDYTGLASMYVVVAKAYTKQVYVDKAFQRKTNALVQKHVTSSPIAAVTDFVAIDAKTIDLIKQKHGGDDTKVINLIKSIEKTAEEESGDPFLIAMADRARQVQEGYEDRQTSTQEALDELFAEIKRNEQRKREQAEKGYDSLRYFVFTRLAEAGVQDADGVSGKVARAFVENPNWLQSEADLRELRKAVTFAIYAVEDDLDRVTRIVDQLFSQLEKARVLE